MGKAQRIHRRTEIIGNISDRSLNRKKIYYHIPYLLQMLRLITNLALNQKPRDLQQQLVRMAWRME